MPTGRFGQEIQPWEQTFLGHGYDDLRGISDRDWSNLYGSQHGFDQYGGITGPGGRVPHPIALDVQAAHERAVFNARNRLGASALNFGLGALGNLQSFRPGGGAAEAAGVYQNLSSVQLNRAAMLQPLDLLGDLRRHEAHQARKSAKKAGTIQAITGIASAAASLLGGPAAGAGVAALGGGLAAQAGGGAAITGTQGPSQLPGAGMLQGGGADPRQFGQQGQQPNPLMSMGGGGGTPWNGPQFAGPAGGIPTGRGGQQASSGGPMTTGSSPGGPSGGPQGGGGEKAGGPGGPAGGGGAGGMAMGPPPVGMDGDFSPLAFATNATQRGMGNPFQQLMETKFRAAVVDMIESDPAWAMLDAAIARQAAARGMAA